MWPDECYDKLFSTIYIESRENERLAQRLNPVRLDLILSHQTWSYKTVDKLCCLANFKSKAFEKSGSAQSS